MIKISKRKKNWQIKKLGEICDLYSGLWKGKVPPYIKIGVIRNTNFTKEGKLNDSDIAYLNVEKRQYEKRKLIYGDIILEKSGGGPKQPVGRVIIFDKQKGNFSFSNFTSVIRIKNSNELDFNFLHKFLFFSYISGITESMQRRSTGIRNLQLKEYKQIQISFPSLSEQRRIVRILDEVFEKVAKAKESAEKNLQNAKEVFESYLRNVFANPGTDWEEERLGEVCKVIAGQSPEGRFYNQSGKGMPFYQGKKEFREKYIGKPIIWTTKTTKEAQKGDILMSVRAPVGPINFATEKICIGRGLTAIRSNKEINKDFLFYNLLSKAKEIVGNVGAVFASINKTNIESLIIFLPSLSTQKTIVAKLDALSAGTKKLEGIYRQKLADLEELKKSVLKRAFNGEL